MMKINLKYISIFAIGGALAFSSCIKSDDSPGYEYMPDMYRSQAIEAYVDYGMVKDDEKSDAALLRKKTLSARTPAEGSIPFKSTQAKAKLFMPYTYENSEKGYANAASNEIPSIFLDDIEENVEEGKRLYTIMCQHCHGIKGQGDGGVVVNGGFNPPNPYNTGLKDRTLGTIFHVITFGKGAMGPHASQLNKVERWKVAMYVRTLQHDGDFKLEELFGGKAEIDFSKVTEEEFASMEKGSKIPLRRVHFNTGSSQLKTTSKEELEKLETLMAKHPDLIIEIAGHTDNTGIETDNIKLSQERALAVLNYMIADGVDASRLIAKGYGSSQPVANNTSERGREINRRIEFEILVK